MSPIDHIEMHTEDLKALMEDLADQIEAASMLSNKEDVAKAAEQAARKLAALQRAIEAARRFEP